MATNPTRDHAVLPEHIHSGNVGDDELVRYLQAGCDRCFDLLFARYWRLVLAISWKILREHAAAEDVVQEVFLTIYLKRNMYDSTRGSIRTWIAQFAHFKALTNRRRLQTQELAYMDELSHFEREMTRISTYQEVLERAALVEECLSSLNSRQRRTIELVHFDGYTLLETAGILEESLANTRNLYYRGMKALRSYLARASACGKKGPASDGESFPAATGGSFVLGGDL